MSNYDNASWEQYGQTTAVKPNATQETAASWGGYTTNNYSNQSKRKCTANQIKFYCDLCRQKVQLIDTAHEEWTFEEMSEEIGRLRGLKSQVLLTAKQKKTIEDVLKRTPEIDINEIAPAWAMCDIEEASTLIGKLFEMERTFRDKRQCTDAQADKMLRMYLCPDVDFTETGWVERYEVVDGRRMLIIPDSKIVLKWLKDNVNSADANAFISKYNAEYIKWATTRVSPEQKRYIQTLEGRCANLYSAGKAVEQVADIEGNLIADNPTTRGAHPREYAPVGYNPLTPLQMYQMSKDDAAKYIECLQVTLSDREQIKFTPEPMNGDRMEDKRVGTGDTAVDNDIAAMANFIHGIYAQLGEELTQEATELAETPTSDFSNPAFAPKLIEQVRALIAHAITVGVGFGSIDYMLDEVPNVRVALGA